MRNIASTFSRLRLKKEGALIAYVTAGDPKPSYTPQIVESLIAGGADIIELGVPFSDPIADGPTIQAATVRALNAGTKPKMVLEMAKKIKMETDTPIVLLTYLNPVFRIGFKKFFEYANACKVDGVIIPDLPIEEASEYKQLAEANDIDTIFLAAPSTSDKRLQDIIEYTSGFLYLITVFGVTGARAKIQNLSIRLIRKTVQMTQKTRLPLAVGFGISKPTHVKTVIENGAEAAIVGSGFVRLIEENLAEKKKMHETLKEYASALKKATL